MSEKKYVVCDVCGHPEMCYPQDYNSVDEEGEPSTEEIHVCEHCLAESNK